MGFLWVDENGFWMINDRSGSLIYHPENEPTPSLPPFSGWAYPDGKRNIIYDDHLTVTPNYDDQPTVTPNVTPRQQEFLLQQVQSFDRQVGDQSLHKVLRSPLHRRTTGEDFGKITLR